MIWHSWIIKVRNKLSELAMECDSCAAIEGSKLTEKEREDIKKALMRVVSSIDKKLYKKSKK